ncbi:hypothetical protein ABT160_45965 [Streptomyces sp. NPDC001941]|uniref:hypothetical protein n=1 Tax=Streptomyces sp. NPDC001941 TaxID=3154659 RepID=UPI00332C6B49
MDTPFSLTYRLDETEQQVTVDDVVELAITAPDGQAVQLAWDEERGWVVLMDVDPESGPSREFEIRPGAANLFFVRTHQHPRATPGH